MQVYAFQMTTFIQADMQQSNPYILKCHFGQGNTFVCYGQENEDRCWLANIQPNPEVCQTFKRTVVPSPNH